MDILRILFCLANLPLFYDDTIYEHRAQRQACIYFISISTFGRIWKPELYFGLLDSKFYLPKRFFWQRKGGGGGYYALQTIIR